MEGSTQAPIQSTEAVLGALRPLPALSLAAALAHALSSHRRARAGASALPPAQRWCCLPPRWRRLDCHPLLLLQSRFCCTGGPRGRQSPTTAALPPLPTAAGAAGSRRHVASRSIPHQMPNMLCIAPAAYLSAGTLGCGAASNCQCSGREHVSRRTMMIPGGQSKGSEAEHSWHAGMQWCIKVVTETGSAGGSMALHGLWFRFSQQAGEECRSSRRWVPAPAAHTLVNSGVRSESKLRAGSLETEHQQAGASMARCRRRLGTAATQLRPHPCSSSRQRPCRPSGRSSGSSASANSARSLQMGSHRMKAPLLPIWSQ